MESINENKESIKSSDQKVQKEIKYVLQKIHMKRILIKRRQLLLVRSGSDPKDYLQQLKRPTRIIQSLLLMNSGMIKIKLNVFLFQAI